MTAHNNVNIIFWFTFFFFICVFFPLQAASQQSSPTGISVPAAAEDQKITPVAKPDHAASSATPKSVQNPNTSSYAPVAPAPLDQKFKRPKVCLKKKNNKKILSFMFEIFSLLILDNFFKYWNMILCNLVKLDGICRILLTYFSLIANYYWKYLDQLLYFLLQYHAPKGGFEIFCVEKPKTKVTQNICSVVHH